MARTVEISVCCPSCGAKPTVFVDAAFAELLAMVRDHLDLDPYERTITQRCPTSGCGRIYPIPISALARENVSV